MTDHLLVELDGHVLRLTLNQPHKKNAFSPEMVGALADTLDSALSDDDVRVVMVTGAGDASPPAAISAVAHRKSPGARRRRRSTG